MHGLTRAVRQILLIVALVAFALPVATSSVTPASAAGTTPGVTAPGNSLGTCGTTADATAAGCYAAIINGSAGSSRVAFNPIGFPHTVTFVCGAATENSVTSNDGCYDVKASVQSGSGAGAVINGATCGTSSAAGIGGATSGGSTIDCSAAYSPLNPAFDGIAASNTATINFNSPTTSDYLITFSGYFAVPGTGTCPAGSTFTGAPFTVHSTFISPGAVGLPTTLETGACAFQVSVEKKYVEVTSLTITPSPNCAAGTILYNEGLKSFFGSSCTIASVTGTGRLTLKTVGDCTGEPNGVAAPAEYGAGAKYSCVAGTLSVINIPLSTFAPAGGLPITLSVNGPLGIGGSGTVLSVGGTPYCTGASSIPGGTVSTTTSAVTGVTFCPTGPGSGTIQASYANDGSLPNPQAAVLSNIVTVNFTTSASGRVVPTVRWAGEKAVLTKCFGGTAGLFAGAPVEFTLQGSTIANASLIPAAVAAGAAPGGVGSTGGGTAPGTTTANTVWTVADARGCATVIVYARSEGVVNVDAAIFSPIATTTGAPILNEHAFTLYYLKFESLNLENLNLSGTVTAAQAASLLSFSSTSLGTFNTGGLFPTAFPTSAAFAGLPEPPGAGSPSSAGPFSIKLCATDYIRAMVRGYFEIPGDPSSRGATTVSLGSNAPSGQTAPAGGFSYNLPAGRWVLPDDWPILASFAGFDASGNPVQNPSNGVGTPQSVMAWDLNSGFAFNPSEQGIFCTGTNNISADATGAFGAGSTVTGPCFGKDTYTGEQYSTGNDLAYGGHCGGVTIGFGPFDPTQACTSPFPLTFSPSSSSALTNTGTNEAGQQTYALGPLSGNSTYLPNGTLNQWDAPMPPAQVSFYIQSGPGSLGEVNKAGLYSLNGSFATSTGACPAYATLSGTTACHVSLYYNPFYAEAIPASPLIPPVTNNGGYLWNTFGSSNGTVLGPIPAGLGTAGSFVAGETTSASALNAGTCAPGTTDNGTVCVVDFGPYTQAQCPTGAQFTATSAAGTTPPTGNCYYAYGNTTTAAGPGGTGIAGGTNFTSFGNCGVLTSGNESVQVADITGFTTGQTVQAYSSTTGAPLANGLIVENVNPGATTINGVYYPNAGYINFEDYSASGAYYGCIPAFSAVFISEQLGIAFPAGATEANFASGTPIGLYNTLSNRSASTSVATPVQVTNYTGSQFVTIGGTEYVLLNGAEAIAQALGNCVLSRGTLSGSLAFGTCEPNTGPNGGFAAAGTTLVTVGPSIGTVPVTGAPAMGAGATGPYPFWQWIPGPSGTGVNKTATVYSDNHGESVVRLNTGLSTVAPLSATGTCPTGYVAAPSAAAPTTCLLDFATLGTAGFNSVTQAQALFNSATPGCLNTTANGAAGTVATGTTAQVGANGPGTGQICVNSLGGIEFGANATLGSTTVQAVADYPYTRGDHPGISASGGALTKVFTSGFLKSVTVSAPVAGPAGTGVTNYTVTITAKDVCGNPIVGEPVQVFAVGNSGAVVLAPMTGSGTPLSTSSAVVVTNAAGQATLSLEVLNAALGNNGLLIKAVFPLERVERFATIVAASGPSLQIPVGPGYNMVGGPSGSNFSGAEGVFSYNAASGQYTNVTSSAGNLSSAAPACTGYFAYYAAAATVNLGPSTSTAGQTVSCTLAPGWNLVGNPFGSPASLPSGTVAYYFDGTAYTTVGQIGLGRAVFIYNASSASTTITLTAT